MPNRPRLLLRFVGRASCVVLVATALLLTSCRPASDSEPNEDRAASSATDAPVQEGTPRLVLLLVVDQMRGDYLDRFSPLFSGGLARLRDTGQFFTNAEQDHATTSTSPGHATIATGVYPSRHGIVGNSWFDRDLGDDVYSVEDDDLWRSPHRLLVPTLAERIEEHWPSAQIYSIGGKDRSAILSVGRAGHVYWYDPRSGDFTTSPFYAPEIADRPEALPSWLQEFNAADWPDQWFGTTWDPRLTPEDLRPFGVDPLDRGAFSTGFPRPFGGPAMGPSRSLYSAIYGSPWMDAYVGELAAHILDSTDIGRDEVPDLLAVTFSATDAVGHSFGPDSPELVDTLIRLDETLGKLLDHVDRTVGLENVVIALSSDHGVGQVPEVARERGRDAARYPVELTLCIQRLGLDLSTRFGLEGTEWMPEPFYLDRKVLTERGVDFDSVATAVAEGLRTCPRVERVFRSTDLAGAEDDELRTLFQRAFHPDRSGDVLVHLSPNTLMTSTTASHGSANRYDRWVPIVFRLPGFPAQRVGTPASVTDIAPTLAAMIGLPGADFDGLNRLTDLEGGPARWDESALESAEARR